ncbi:hypothetical protein IFM89_026309 [Coptis chinensis]|uniref:Ubiquitin thioesterase OTU n=1 Tax=Coptis chinensis TaxID=261450 RepID=A0A835LWM1_9MAGN|nr:hypothetical protein IFM89_026309 [Coptis chinensis]
MEGIVVRRVIPADNSCLFNAVGYVMEHDKLKAPELRQVIAATVASDPVKYTEAFLGKSNEEYCAWILDPEKWGGAIELSILAEYYGREIAAHDIQTSRCDLYGQAMNYPERVMLIYDGLHYDALAIEWGIKSLQGGVQQVEPPLFTKKRQTMGLDLIWAFNRVEPLGLNDLNRWACGPRLDAKSDLGLQPVYESPRAVLGLLAWLLSKTWEVLALYINGPSMVGVDSSTNMEWTLLTLPQMCPFEGSPEEFDQTIFTGMTIGPIEALALNLVKDAQRKRSYTDTANFTLRCSVCQIGVSGQKEAIEHAQTTGHANFQEYK